MSSRIFRRLHGKDSLIEQGDDVSDTFENDASNGGGARRKTLPVNPFDVLENSQSESDADSVKDDAKETQVVKHIQSEDSVSKRKKKKKKKGRPAVSTHKQEENDPKLDDSIFDTSVYGEPNVSTSNQCDQNTPTAINIKRRNLNANNELKRIFGSRIVENDNGNRRNRGGRVPIKMYAIVNPKETWPPLGKTGISMKLEKVDDKNFFSYVHSPDYQKIQRRFLFAVDSLNPDNIAVIINSYPYHVDALIQLSDLYKLNDDLQMAAELNERALYCLEAGFHSLFNIARGQCLLDYRRQENRALFICLYKHLIFVGQRACYQTALELCKLVLSLDFDTDPMAILLCIDFYSLRCHSYTWLIDASNEWETKKNLSQLPNFAYSTALAHFHLAQNGQTDDYSVADNVLQKALISFPGVLSQLLDKCSIQCDPVVSKHPFFTSEAELGQSRSLTRLILLYVHRTYHEWKNPTVLPWLERNVHIVLERVNSCDPFVKDCAEKRSRRFPSTPRNVLRHIILSDIKEVTSTIARDITSPILSFDPLPPLDSVDLYIRHEHDRSYEQSPTLSLFFRSLLPNFNVNAQQGNRVFRDRPANGEAARILVEGQGGAGHAPAAIGDTLRYRVTVLMDAIGLVIANMPTRNEGDDNEGNERHLRADSDELEGENVPDTSHGSNNRQDSSSEPTQNTERPNTERDNEQE